jgi:oxygen-independent coproporphyrinogen-3 oxidase
MGGGTPSVLDFKYLEKLLLSLRRFSKKSAEFTIEANPESLTMDMLSLFLSEGVNRISIGVQSFDNAKLKKLGRIHDCAMAVDAVKNAARAGFVNISVDLMFGVWSEEIPTWKEDLARAAGLPVTHISCYSLTYEEGAPIRAAVKNGSLIPLEEEAAADMYNLAISDLADRGFRQYEISSFSKPGFSCKHNLSYWDNNSYTGLGPSAVSYTDGVRREFVSDVSEYIDKVRSGVQPVRSSEKLPPKARAKETAAVKIRTMEGIDLDWFKLKTGYEFLDLESGTIPKLMEDGLVEYKRSGSGIKGLRLTNKGILFCDSVSSAFL